MTVRIDILREAIKFCRENPEKHNQGRTYRTSDGTGCIIGHSAKLSVDVNGYGPVGYRGFYDFGQEHLGLGEDDLSYIFSALRTLDQIEARVNEIAARQDEVSTMISIRIDNRPELIEVKESDLPAFIAGAKAANPDVVIRRVVEEIIG